MAVHALVRKVVADNSPPSVVPNFSAVALSSTQIQLDWGTATDAAPGIVAYYRVRLNGIFYTELVASIHTLQIAGLTPDTDYTVTIAAVDNSFNEGPQTVDTIVHTQSANNYKWHPGEMIGASYQFGGETIATVKAWFDIMRNYPQFKTGYLVLSLRKLLLAPGVYDWTPLDQCIDYLNNTTIPGRFVQARYFGVELWTVKFEVDTVNATQPGYHSCPDYYGTNGWVDVRPYSWNPSKCSTVADISNPACRADMIAFYQAMGTRYNGNPWFEIFELFGESDQNTMVDHLTLIDAIKPYWQNTNLCIGHNWIMPDPGQPYNPGPQDSYFAAQCVARNIGLGGPDLAPFTYSGINAPSYESDGMLAWRGAGVVGGKNYGTTDHRGKVPYKLGRELENNTLSFVNNDNTQIIAHSNNLKITHRHWWPYYGNAWTWQQQFDKIIVDLAGTTTWQTYPTGYGSGGGASSFALTQVANNRLFPRTGTTCDIPVAGTYSGSFTDVQVRVLNHPSGTEALTWTTVDSVLTGNVWSGVMPAVPQGGPYKFEARIRTAGVVQLSAAGTNPFYVGDLYGVIGSSTPELWAADYGGITLTAVAQEFNSNVWSDYGPGNWHLPKGSGINGLVNDLYIEFGVPIGVIPFGRSGSTLAQWSQGMSYIGYADFMNNGVIPAGGKLTGVISIVGLNDAPSIVSRAAHLTALRLLRDTVRSNLGQAALKWYQLASQRYVSGSDAKFLMLHQAETDFGADANTYLASSIGIPQEADQLHPTATGMRDQGRRVALLIADATSDDTYSRGPFISGIANVDATHTDITLTHRGGTDFTPTSGSKGFRITDNAWAGTLAISAWARQSATVIRITHASAGGTRDVRYMDTAYPDDSEYVRDNTPRALPLEFYAP